MGSTHPDVVVIGGGAVGASCAYELTRMGASVWLVERGGELAAGCSSGNAGLMRTSHAEPLATRANLAAGLRWMFRRDSPFYIRPRATVVPWLLRFAAATTKARVEAGTKALRAISKHSLGLHREYAESGIDTGYRMSGVIVLHETSRGFAEGRARVAHDREIGIASEILDETTLREAIPALGSGVAGAVFYPGDPHCEPRRFVVKLAEAAAQAGARIKCGTEVKSFQTQGDRILSIETGDGRISAAEIVLAAGVWSRGLGQMLGLRLPIEGAKGYHVDVSLNERTPRVPVVIDESRVACTPLGGYLRFSGTLELAGLDMSIDPVRIDAIKRAGRRNVGHFDDGDIKEVWCGLRPASPDGLPIVGRPRAWRNLVLATGHGMQGLHFGPVTGRLVAEIVGRKTPSHDVTLMSPNRF